MKDFTLHTYRLLLKALKDKNYRFLTFEEFIKNSSLVTPHSSLCILRHDVDRKPLNALTTARLENELGIKGTYYFRIVDGSFDETIIMQIVEMGHEIGYHYEDVDLVQKEFANSRINEFRIDSLVNPAWESFKKNLVKLRRIVPVTTICMHGSPLSKYDNKIIWEKYDYKELGIIGEPYLDLNWNEFSYFTDTGRRWDGVSVRDKVQAGNHKSVISSQNPEASIQYPSSSNRQKYQSSFDIIDALKKNTFPKKVMITVHPERWNDNLLIWTEELVSQNFKNVVKKWFFVKSKQVAVKCDE